MWIRVQVAVECGTVDAKCVIELYDMAYAEKPSLPPHHTHTLSGYGFLPYGGSAVVAGARAAAGRAGGTPRDGPTPTRGSRGRGRAGARMFRFKSLFYQYYNAIMSHETKRASYATFITSNDSVPHMCPRLLISDSIFDIGRPL